MITVIGEKYRVQNFSFGKICIALCLIMFRYDSFCDEYSPAFQEYAKAFATEGINEVLEDKDFPELKKLTTDDFKEKMKKTTDIVGVAVSAYMKGKIQEPEFISRITHAGIDDVGRDIIQCCGVDLKALGHTQENPVNLASPVVGFMAMCKAYEILMKALDDAHIAYEHRLQIEEQCNKSIEMIKEYRLQMEESFSKLQIKNIDTFEEGFSAMDQAILDGDSDGYIKGNNIIQEIFNYDIQFHNQEEFDDLMESDIAFKL